MILQADLLTIQKWSKTWQMEFNPSKCEHLQITNKHNYIDTHYTLYGHTIQKVTHAKYPGLIFDCHLSWKSHISTITAKVNAAQAFLRSTTFCPTEAVIKPLFVQLWNILLLPGHHTLYIICLNLSQFSVELPDMFLMIICHSIVFLPCLTD